MNNITIWNEIFVYITQNTIIENKQNVKTDGEVVQKNCKI